MTTPRDDRRNGATPRDVWPTHPHVAFSRAAQKVVQDPLGFLAQTVRAFRANQGLLLAGGVAYYTLLSLVPLMILLVIILSHAIDADRLMATLARYIGIVAPGQSAALMNELRSFIAHRDVIGWTLAATLIFFSSLAFSVLENAMSVIFYHRVLTRRRPFMISVLIPYLYILLLGIGLLVVTLVAGALQALGLTTLDILGHDWSLSWVSRVLLYLIGVSGEVLVLASIYFVMPVGHILLKQVIQLLQAEIIDREDIRQSMQVIMNMTRRVKNGENFLIFAEGTRSRNGNRLLEFKGGSFKSAMNAKCPIVPVALIDSFKPRSSQN
jgi:uncharacterized BrkB/YihY/UPF0761 family membrane protein